METNVDIEAVFKLPDGSLRECVFSVGYSLKKDRTYIENYINNLVYEQYGKIPTVIEYHILNKKISCQGCL